MFIQDPLNAQPESPVAPVEEVVDHKALIQTSINMYIACSWFVQKAKTKGKDEKVIKQECLSFLALMIQKLNEESK